jgi:hypothetical protein
LPPCQPQIPYDLIQAQTWVAVEGSQRLIAWAMTRAILSGVTYCLTSQYWICVLCHVSWLDVSQILCRSVLVAKEYYYSTIIFINEIILLFIHRLLSHQSTLLLPRQIFLWCEWFLNISL